jgi:CRISPR-associated protein Cas1
MKGVELYGQVRRAVYVEGLSRREAARRFGIDPRTVAKMLAFSVPPGYRRGRPPARPNLLRRNHLEPPPIALAQLKRYAEAALNADDLGELLGIEGNAARIYFANFTGLLKVDGDGGDKTPLNFEFARRNRRPPTDPVNALLSFSYSLLAKDLTIICHSVGFDPFIGFYHQQRFGRPALALDLMEGFRLWSPTR